MVLREINEIEDKRELMSPTVEWMAKKYAEMNALLFNGALGKCYFGIFTTGKGSGGGTLGWFKITGNNVKYDRNSRRMFRASSPYGFMMDRTYVNHDNFVDICVPTIELNGNYRWTEKAALSTLVHEMCHYYNYMYGFVPMQAHGREFREIAYHVSSKSNGIFTVERLAKAEQMQEMELIGKAKEKLERKASKTTAVFVYKDDGEIRLINCSTKALVDEIIYTESLRNSTIAVKTSNDESLINFIFTHGFRKVMRTYRFWRVQDKPWVKDLDNFDLTTVYSKKEGYNMRNAADKTEEPKKAEPLEKRIRLFKITLNGGQTFELRNVSEEELRNSLKEPMV